MSCPFPVPERCSPFAFISQAASNADSSKFSFFPPCPKLKDSSSACNIHGLLGLGVQGKDSSGDGRATRTVVFTIVVMVFKWFCC